MNTADIYLSTIDSKDHINYVLKDKENFDDSILDIVVHNDNIVPVECINVDGRTVVSSSVEQDKSLYALRNVKLSKIKVINMLKEIINTLMSGIPYEYIVLDSRYMYLNEECDTVCFSIIPVVNERNNSLDITDIIRYVLSNLSFDVKGNDSYVVDIFNMINSVDFSLGRLSKYITEISTINNSGMKRINKELSDMMSEIRLEKNMSDILGNVGTSGLGETVKLTHENLEEKKPIFDGGLQGTLIGQLNKKPVPHIVRKKTGEIINISKTEFTIGKSKLNADYAIENNSAISRVHCTIIQRDGLNYLFDNASTNHTFVDGVMLQPEREVLLKNKSVIRLGNEEFTFFLRKGE